MSLKRLEELESRLKAKCHIYLRHKEYFGWVAGVETNRNEYPYWIEYRAETPRKAVNKLLRFFNGKLEDHARNKRTAKDFLA